MGALDRELVRRGDERQARQLGNLGRGRLGEAGCRVDAGTHRRAAEREPVDGVQRIVDPLEIVRQHARIARPFLPERDRRGVLHMGTADLDDVLPLLGLRRDRVVQPRDRRNQPLRHIDRRRHVHGGGKRVIGRLCHVDVVVGMNRRLAPERRAGDLAAAVRDHLVHVHVELRAAAGHPHMQRVHVVMLAGKDLVTYLEDQLPGLVVEPLVGMVRVGGGLFSRWRTR